MFLMQGIETLKWISYLSPDNQYRIQQTQISMEIEVKELMNDNNSLSHIFIGCMSREEITAVRDKFVGVKGNAKDWRIESVTIPVEMTIGGIPVNPKEFFKSWENQMNRMISAKATHLLSEKVGSQKMQELTSRMQDLENILKEFESEITWEVENPFQEPIDEPTEPTNNAVQDGCYRI